MNNSNWKSFFSKLTLAATVGAGAAFQSGVLSGKGATYAAIGLAMLQAFQPRVQATGAEVEAHDAVSSAPVSQ